jgi:hypothetical protein
MKGLYYYTKIRMLQNLIQVENTGTLKELCILLNMKEKALRDMIEDLRTMGYNVKYNRKLRTYIYL